MLVGSELFLHAAALEQLLEATQRETDRLPLVNAHSQRHSSSFRGKAFTRRRGESRANGNIPAGGIRVRRADTRNP
jgi:hypothetical protein